MDDMDEMSHLLSLISSPCLVTSYYVLYPRRFATLPAFVIQEFPVCQEVFRPPTIHDILAGRAQQAGLDLSDFKQGPLVAEDPRLPQPIIRLASFLSCAGSAPRGTDFSLFSTSPGPGLPKTVGERSMERGDSGDPP